MSDMQPESQPLSQGPLSSSFAKVMHLRVLVFRLVNVSMPFTIKIGRGIYTQEDIESSK